MDAGWYGSPIRMRHRSEQAATMPGSESSHWPPPGIARHHSSPGGTAERRRTPETDRRRRFEFTPATISTPGPS
jgi:hypothetical protein